MHRFGDILEEAILGIQSETAEFQVIRDAKDCIGPHWYGLRCRVTCRHFRTGFYLHIGLISNDVEAGWAGSLGMEPGIHLVSGTGSIAFGKNKAGKSKRSGSWSAFFGDEGSCCWLGRRTMELFSKQADGRIPVGPLYHMMRERFQLKQDMDFIACMEAEYIPVRSKTASLQKLLLAQQKRGMNRQNPCIGNRQRNWE